MYILGKTAEWPELARPLVSEVGSTKTPQVHVPSKNNSGPQVYTSQNIPNPPLWGVDEQDLKKKLTLYNTFLTQLQAEKSNLILKSDNLFSENESQNVHLAHLYEENRILRGGIERLEMDIDRLKNEYNKLAELLFKE